MELRAFEAAVTAHQRRVFSFAAYMLGERGEAEDVTQEVLVRLWRHHEKLDSDRIGGWLLRVTRNACFDRLRHRRSSARLVAVGADDAGLEQLVSSEPDPEALAGASQLGALLQRELTRLPESQRAAVVLREIHGLSYQEIADALDVPVDRVRVNLHRGRRALRERLGQEVASERHTSAAAL